jgi:hypothetical protein
MREPRPRAVSMAGWLNAEVVTKMGVDLDARERFVGHPARLPCCHRTTRSVSITLKRTRLKLRRCKAWVKSAESWCCPLALSASQFGSEYTFSLTLGSARFSDQVSSNRLAPRVG